MKKYIFFLKVITALFFCCIISACSFSKGVKKDLATGMTYSYNGFRVDEVSLSDIYGKPLKTIKLPEGSIVYTVITGIKGYTVQNELVYPGCSLEILDAAGNVLEDTPDLFGDATSSPKDAESVTMHVKLIERMSVGGTYTVKYHYFDKKNDKNTIDIIYNVEVTPNAFQADIKQEGLTIKELRIVDQKNGMLPENKCFLNSKIGIVMSGIEGFTEIENKVYPGCSLKLIDEQGTIIVNKTDLFEEPNGVEPNKLAVIIPKVDLSQVEVGKTYQLAIQVFDKKDTKKELTINAKIEIVK